jgi:hypothetical protein
MGGADAKQALGVTGGVVVPVDARDSSLVHDESTSPLPDQAPRHADMVWMEVSHDEGVHGRLVET